MSINNENDEMETNLQALFLAELARLYDAEKQIVQALPKLIEAAESEDLRGALGYHLDETQVHIQRLEEIFAAVDETPTGRACTAIQGILDEGEKLIREQEGKPGLDAAIIAAAQKVEHYEIACYGTVRTWAAQMGEEEAADLLQETLDEEAVTDETLSKIAGEQANEKAHRAA